MATREKLTNGERLLWVKRNGGQWWPALRFENYGQALQQLSTQLDPITKSSLTLTYLSSPHVSVAHLLATNEFIPLSQLKTKDFHENLYEIYSKKSHELEKPMSVVEQLLLQDVADPATGQIVVTSTVDIDANDPWEVVWEKMCNAGWKKKISKRGNQYWVVPGGDPHGVHGKDYFSSLDDVQAHVMKEFGWIGIARQKQKKDKIRIWGRPNSTVVYTPENQKTKPQDPGKPLLAGDDEEEFTRENMLPKLKREGWFQVSAARYNPLGDEDDTMTQSRE